MAAGNHLVGNGASAKGARENDFEPYASLVSAGKSMTTGTCWDMADRISGGLLQWAYDEMHIEGCGNQTQP